MWKNRERQNRPNWIHCPPDAKPLVMAGTIVGAMYGSGRADIQAVGKKAVQQAIWSVRIAQAFLEGEGLQTFYEQRCVQQRHNGRLQPIIQIVMLFASQQTQLRQGRPE
jgi:stage V sporulation protein SpoVS